MQNSSSKGMKKYSGLLELTRAHPPPPRPASSKQSGETLHKLKPIIGSQAKWRCLAPSDLRHIRKYRPKMHFDVEISRLSVQNIGMRGTEDLRRALVDCKGVSSLSFNQELKDDKNAEHLVRLLNSSNHFKRLKHCYNEKDRVLSDETVKSLGRLRRCRNISDLEIDLKCNELNKNKIVHRLSTQSKGLSKLKSLNLCVTNFENGAILPLKIPKSLTSLGLNFHGRHLVYHPIFILLSATQYCNLLKHIRLNESGFSNIEPPEAQSWANIFENTQNLQTLSVTKDFGHNQQLEAIKTFFDGFQFLKPLKVLALRFSFNFEEQNPETLADLFYDCLTINLGSLTELEELQLDFMNDLKTTNLHLQSLGQALQNCVSLKKLRLTLPSEKISDEGIISFANSLKKLVSLKFLLMNIPFATVGPKSMKILSEAISSLPLTSLDLAFSPEQNKSVLGRLSNFLFNTSVLTSLFSAIGHLKLLKTLGLNLAKFDLSTSNYQDFLLALKDLKHLKSLSLQLPQSDANKKYQGFQSFLSVFKELPLLSSLYLTFCGEFCNQEVSFISDSLKGCKSLEILELCFEESQKLNEESLSHLEFGIQGLVLLKNLKLEFFQNDHFDTTAVFELLKALTVLKRLETMKFREDCGNCRNCRDPRAADLPIQLNGYQSLRNLQSFVVNQHRYV